MHYSYGLMHVKRIASACAEYDVPVPVPVVDAGLLVVLQTLLAWCCLQLSQACPAKHIETTPAELPSALS